MWQPTCSPDKRSPVSFDSIWHATDSLSFGVFVILSFFVVFCSACKSSCLLPCLPLYVTGLSLTWADKDDYSEWLAAWLNGCSYLQCASHGMAAAHVLMTASHWTDYGATQHNTPYCTPVPLFRGLQGLG